MEESGDNSIKKGYLLYPIAWVESCFKEKFGTPRQAGLVPSAKSKVVFSPECRHPEAFRGLESFSHIWLIFLFHQSASQGWHPTVRPPRLGGNERMGVFATRSPFRPNPIGLSAVRLEAIDFNDKNGPVLHISGADLVDGTPVLDIKPYIPYADSLDNASGGFAGHAPESVPVLIPPELEQALAPEWVPLIHQTLGADPRPAYHEDTGREYGLRLGPYNLRWVYQNKQINVVSITPHDS